MKKNFWSLLFISSLFLFTPLLTAQENKKVSPPSKMFYDDKKLSYNPSWKDKEIYLEANLDNDPEPEIIIGFVATYKPEPESKEEPKPPFSVPEKQEVPILQNYAFYQIYDKGSDGYYQLVKTITGMDQLGTVKIIKLGENDPGAVAILSPGGERYMDLSIYQWKEGGYRLLFNKGSSDGIELSEGQPAAISIGGHNNPTAPVEIFAWDSTINNFKRR